MDVFRSVLGARIVVILGIIGLVSGATLLMTCRWVPVARITKHFMNNSFYKVIFKYHSFIWWVFWTVAVVHVVFAINLMGWPF